MGAKSRNTKKPKLNLHHPVPGVPAGLNLEVPAPDKHKLSFAQHQHELQVEHTPTPMPVQADTGPHLKSDAQQRQQKTGSRK